MNSFLSEVTLTVTFLFVGKVPQKCFCECLIGKCGLCCHVIVILLQLERFELFLLLTCTQKLQKKHKPVKRRKSIITTASHICLKYFRNGRFATHEVTQKRQKRRVTATPENVDSCRDTSDWLKRDIIQISSKLSNGISKCNMDVSSHILQILQ